jgi:hypothetical protein
MEQQNLSVESDSQDETHFAGNPDCDCRICFPLDNEMRDEDIQDDDSFDDIDWDRDAEIPFTEEHHSSVKYDDIFFKPPKIGDLMNGNLHYCQSSLRPYTPVVRASFGGLHRHSGIDRFEERYQDMRDEDQMWQDVDYICEYSFGHNIQENFILTALHQKQELRRFRLPYKDQPKRLPKIRYQKRREAKLDFMQTA